MTQYMGKLTCSHFIYVLMQVLTVEIYEQ